MADASGEALRDPWGNMPLGLTTALSIHRPKPFPGYGCLQRYRGFCYIVGGVISPLLANIALNSLDWRLHDAGFRLVRYADDFVVLCRTEAQVQEAHDLVQRHLTSLGLTLSAEKTKRTRFREGFAFLGFVISAWSVTMRPKAVEKFKAKVRELTPRHHNLDAMVIRKLNSVIRGTANYFAPLFSSIGNLFRGLDRWIRMRLRCMKYKRKSRADNGRFRLVHFRRLGLCFLSELRRLPV